MYFLIRVPVLNIECTSMEELYDVMPLDDPEYVKLFKEINRLFQSHPHELRGIHILIACRWSAFFYYVLWLFHVYKINPSQSKEFLRSFMKHIFNPRIGFLVEKDARLAPLQDMYMFNLFSSSDQYTPIRTVDDLYALLQRETPTSKEKNTKVFEMGILRTNVYGEISIPHYFVLVVIDVVGSSDMYTVSSWGGFSRISQYPKRVDMKKLQKFLDDINTTKSSPVDLTTITVHPNGDMPPICDIPEEEVDKIKESLLWKHFLDPSFGVQTLCEKEDVPFKVKVRGSTFYATPSLASVLDYCEQTSPGNGTTTLFAFNHVTSALDNVFHDYVRAEYPLQPSRTRITRSKKKKYLSAFHMGTPSTTHKVRKWNSTRFIHA